MESNTDAHDEIDWNEIARKALGSAVFAAFVGGAMQVLSDVVRAELKAASKRNRKAEAPFDEPTSTEVIADRSDELVEAGELLGVDPQAGEAEIRAALRAYLAESRVHPDHGGDAEEAKRLIAAQNLLLEHARSRSKP
jgi:hypothetical protein